MEITSASKIIDFSTKQNTNINTINDKSPPDKNDNNSAKIEKDNVSLKENLNNKLTERNDFSPVGNLSFTKAASGGGEHITGHISKGEPSNYNLGSLNNLTYNGRIESLKHISQLDDIKYTSKTSDENRCGAACITSACLYTGGLQKLIDVISATNTNMRNNKVDIHALNNIKLKLQANQDIKLGDISKVQDALYKVLNEKEVVNSSTKFPKKGPYLFNDSINKFISTHPEIKEMFNKYDIKVRNIDTDGDGKGNHFILDFKHQGRDVIYDPYPRGEGQQVTTKAEYIQKYKSLVKSEAY